MLTADDLSYINECLEDISGDIEEPITYKRYLSTTKGDKVMGEPDTFNYDDNALVASVRELTIEEIKVSGGVYVLGDMEFKIRKVKIEFEPGYPDRISYSGGIYKPKSIKPSFLGDVITWTIRAGKE